MKPHPLRRLVAVAAWSTILLSASSASGYRVFGVVGQDGTTPDALRLAAHNADGTHDIYYRTDHFTNPQGAWVTAIDGAASAWNSVRGMQRKFRTIYPTAPPNYAFNSYIGLKRMNDAAGRFAFVTFTLRPSSTGGWEYQRIRIHFDHYDALNIGEPPNCTTGSQRFWRSVAIHEFGHALGLAHHGDISRTSHMRTGDVDAPYCGGPLTLRQRPHPDDIWGGRDQYPDQTVGRDLAALAWWSKSLLKLDGTTQAGPNNPGSRRPDRFVSSVCPGSLITQGFAVSNLGTERITYDRDFYLSSNQRLDSSDIVVASETNRIKSPGARVGVFQGSHRWPMLRSDWPAGPVAHVLMNIENASPRENTRTNNWTHFAQQLRQRAGCW